METVLSGCKGKAETLQEIILNCSSRSLSSELNVSKLQKNPKTKQKTQTKTTPQKSITFNTLWTMANRITKKVKDSKWKYKISSAYS